MVLWHSFPYRAPTAPPLSGVDPGLAAEPQASSLLPLSESAGLGWLFVAFRFLPGFWLSCGLISFGLISAGLGLISAGFGLISVGLGLAWV